MEQKSKDAKDTLYYDGTCPLCSKEISLLKKLIKPHVNFSDIHTLTEDNHNIPKKQALLRRLHLQQANGSWLVGLDANVVVWSYTKYGILFKGLRLPIINRMADAAYNWWADKRFQKRYQCSKSCLKNDEPS